jgi:hypothetical protein
MCSSPGASRGFDSWGEWSNQSRRVTCPTSVATWSSSILEVPNFPATWTKFVKRIGVRLSAKVRLGIEAGFQRLGPATVGVSHKAHAVICRGALV